MGRGDEAAHRRNAAIRNGRRSCDARYDGSTVARRVGVAASSRRVLRDVGATCDVCATDPRSPILTRLSFWRGRSVGLRLARRQHVLGMTQRHGAVPQRRIAMADDGMLIDETEETLLRLDAADGGGGGGADGGSGAAGEAMTCDPDDGGGGEAAAVDGGGAPDEFEAGESNSSNSNNPFGGVAAVAREHKRRVDQTIAFEKHRAKTELFSAACGVPPDERNEARRARRPLHHRCRRSGDG